MGVYALRRLGRKVRPSRQFRAGSGKAAFISLSGLSGQRLLTESQAGALENGLEKPLLA